MQLLILTGDRLHIHPVIIIPGPVQNRFITVVQELIRVVALINQPPLQDRFIQNQVVQAGRLTQSRQVEVPGRVDHILDQVEADHLTAAVQALQVPGVQVHQVHQVQEVQVHQVQKVQGDQEAEDKTLVN